MEKSLNTPEVEALLGRWLQRDRFVALCVADYTDMALGLGETRLGLCLFACSSAHIWHAHSGATRMGHEAQGLPVAGDGSEEFKRMLGVAGRAWSRSSKWGYRYLELSIHTSGDAELGLVFARGDLKKSRPELLGDVAELRRLINMYGVESAEPSRSLFVVEETSKLENLPSHPKLWRWMAAAAYQGEDLGRRST